MQLLFDAARVQRDTEGFWLALRVKSPAQAREFADKMRSVLYRANLVEHREKRSLDANAYLWVLCQKIAEAVKNITKEIVYQDAVKHSGQFDMMVFRNDAVSTFIHRWAGHGLGWFAEPIDGSIEGYTQVIAYYGSSVYSTTEMAFLLDYVINQAKDLGLETLPPDEIERIKSLWATNNAGFAERTEAQIR